MKAVLICLKNLAFGVVGAIIMSYLIDVDTLPLYLKSFGWGTYIACKTALELIKLDDEKNKI